MVGYQYRTWLWPGAWGFIHSFLREGEEFRFGLVRLKGGGHVRSLLWYLSSYHIISCSISSYVL